MMDYEKKYARRMPLCLECGNVIRYGRTDKKFCCDKCKNKHNNLLAKASRSFRTKVLKTLDQNYGILENLLRSGTDSADLTELLSLGFAPAMVTSYTKARKSGIFTCYDIKYRLTETRICSITRLHLHPDPVQR